MKKLIYLSSLLLVFAACKKDDDTPDNTNNNTNNTNNTPSSWFIQYTSGGVVHTYAHDGLNNALSYESGGSIGTDSISLDLGSGITEITSLSGPSIVFNHYDFANSAYYGNEANALASIFALGSRNYNLAFFDYPGVEIYWRNPNTGETMSSEYTANSSSSFNITESVAYTNGSNQFRRVRGTFNCTVQGDMGSPAQELTNGTFYLEFEAY